MDILDLLVYLLVLYIGVLFPIAGWLWEYARPWAKALWRDWREFRAQRRIGGNSGRSAGSPENKLNITNGRRCENVRTNEKRPSKRQL